MNGKKFDEPTYSARTIAHYNRNAGQFWEGTRDHDVTQNRAALLGAIETPGPYRILDFGCGPGRDLRYFADLGHEAIGLDGSSALATLARAHSGCEVLVQDFLDITLTDNCFDGVFANASLFHVGRVALPGLLRQLKDALKPKGVLFSSNPRGNDEEGMSGDRFSCLHSEEGWRRLVGAAGFVELDHFYRPEGLPRAQQRWFATVWRKVNSF
ncbi:MAG: methyltransferase domain-containing protein [Alphaproteobacteria bacterium]